MLLKKSLRNTTSKIVTLAKSGQIGCARKLFDEMSERDSVAWNAMLTSYSQAGLYQESIAIFDRMRSSKTSPDHFTLTAALSASAGSIDLRLGAKVHALTILFGFRSIIPVDNALIDMYGKCASPSSARRVFEEMTLKNEVTWCSLLYAYTNSGQFESARRVFLAMPKRVEISWNILISGHARHGDIESCFSVFKEMLKNSFVPDQWTLSSLMTVCSDKLEFRYGVMIHCFVAKSGWISASEATNSIISFYAETGRSNDVKKFITCSSWNTMIDASMKLGDTEEALLTFRRSPEKSVVTWTSMISGYARNGLAEQALSFFTTMTRKGIEPDDFSFGAVLHACSSLAVLGIGMMAHGSLIRHGFEAFLYVGNGLVNMYAKCGDLKGSTRAFRQIPCKDIVSWNAALFAFGLHGKPTEVMRFYREMLSSRIKPDKVTFVGLFMTCSHSGLLELGRELRESMGSDHDLSLETDHVACIVDMLSRGGFLAEAKELAHECLGRNSHEALLGQCFEHRDIRSGTGMGEALRVLEPSEEMSYVVLSNLYCASGQWKNAEMVRRAMADEGVKKTPGCSWIEVRNTVKTFVAGNHHNSHDSHKAELYHMLNILKFEMRNPCSACA